MTCFIVWNDSSSVGAFLNLWFSVSFFLKIICFCKSRVWLNLENHLTGKNIESEVIVWNVCISTSLSIEFYAFHYILIKIICIKKRQKKISLSLITMQIVTANIFNHKLNDEWTKLSTKIKNNNKFIFHLSHSTIC